MPLSVLGYQPYSASHRVSRVLDFDLFAAQKDLAPAFLCGSVQKLHGFRPPASREGRRSPVFPLVQRKADIPDAVSRKAFDAENFFADRLIARRIFPVSSRPTMKRMSSFMFVSAMSRVVMYCPSRMNAHPVGDPEHFLEAVRDIDDGNPLFLQTPDDGHELFDLVGREGAVGSSMIRSLISFTQRPRDLDDLLVSDRKFKKQASAVES